MQIILPVITSFLVTITLMPIIIKLFRSINLLDIPDNRKIHSVSTPSLGGIAIVFGILFSLLLSASFNQLATEKFLLAASLLIFLLGVRDDLSSLTAKHKLVVQLFAAFLVVFFGGIEISGLHGLFGISEFPFGLSKLFTICIIVVMTNAFNLIDGIDGLAGSIGVVVMLFFSWYFLQVEALIDAIISLAIMGSVLGFLMFNWYPSKVFMGDTGSMTLGFMITTMIIKFLSFEAPDTGLIFYSPVALCIALLILPIYDTLRVFFIRFYQGKSPLSPDRNHIHHVLLKLGLNHGQSTIFLISYNIIIISFVIAFQDWGNIILILISFGVSILIGLVLDLRIIKKEATRTAKLITTNNMKLSKSA